MSAFAIIAPLFWATATMACERAAIEEPLVPEVVGALEGHAQLGPIVLSEPFDIRLTFCGEAMANIRRVEVSAIMPAHQHGMNYTPVVTSVDDGQFHVSNMLFHMRGSWDVKVGVFTDQAPVFFTLPLKLQ